MISPVNLSERCKYIAKHRHLRQCKYLGASKNAPAYRQVKVYDIEDGSRLVKSTNFLSNKPSDVQYSLYNKSSILSEILICRFNDGKKSVDYHYEYPNS